jgi:hypothetical protein
VTILAQNASYHKKQEKIYKRLLKAEPHKRFIRKNLLPDWIVHLFWQRGQANPRPAISVSLRIPEQEYTVVCRLG